METNTPHPPQPPPPRVLRSTIVWLQVQPFFGVEVLKHRELVQLSKSGVKVFGGKSDDEGLPGVCGDDWLFDKLQIHHVWSVQQLGGK